MASTINRDKGIPMLTTIDNPFNPFTDFDAWNAFDESKDYYTTNYLARVIITSDELPQALQDDAMIRAIDEIISINSTGLYKRVYEKA